jgi:hypothetical protein
MLCGNQSTALRAATDPFEALFCARRVELPTANENDNENEKAPAVQSAGVVASDTPSSVAGDSIADTPSQPTATAPKPKRTSRRKKSTAE